MSRRDQEVVIPELSFPKELYDLMVAYQRFCAAWPEYEDDE